MATREELAIQLNDNRTALHDAYVRRGELSRLSLKQRAESIKAELLGRGSVAGADRRADIDTVDIAADLARLSANIINLEDERDHLRFVIKHGLEGFV